MSSLIHLAFLWEIFPVLLVTALAVGPVQMRPRGVLREGRFLARSRSRPACIVWARVPYRPLMGSFSVVLRRAAHPERDTGPRNHHVPEDRAGRDGHPELLLPLQRAQTKVSTSMERVFVSTVDQSFGADGECSTDFELRQVK